MITFKIGKLIKIQKYKDSGAKLFIKINNKWYCIKFSENKLNLMYFAIKILVKDLR